MEKTQQKLRKFAKKMRFSQQKLQKYMYIHVVIQIKTGVKRVVHVVSDHDDICCVLWVAFVELEEPS